MFSGSEIGCCIGPDVLPIMFNGKEPKKFPQFLDSLIFFLKRHEIPIPARNKPWLELNQLDFVEEIRELHVLTANEIAANYTLRYLGYNPGDYRLKLKNRIMWAKTLEENALKKAHAISFLSLSLVPGSYAESIIIPGKAKKDFKLMYFALIDRFQENRIDILLPFVIKYVRELKSVNEHKYSIDKFDFMSEHYKTFESLVLQDSLGENDKIKNDRIVYSGELWHTLVNIVILSFISKNKNMVDYFFQKHIRENKTSSLEINLVELHRSLRNFCDNKYLS